MQIYELIANLFILAISLCLFTVTAFFFYVTGDVTLDKLGVDENIRYIIITCVLIAVIIILI
jgi:hypothetical protein